MITKQAWAAIKVNNIFPLHRDKERWSGIIKKFVPPFLLTVLVFLVFHRSVTYFFVQDDFVWLRIAASMKEATQLLDSFLQYNGAGFYRPLTQEVFYFLNYKLFGLNPVPFHVVSICFHAINSMLVYGILRQMKLQRMACLAGAIFYGVNSSAFITVYCISAITESGMALFYLSSVLLFLRYMQEGRRSDYCLSFTACVLALMSKEPAVTIPIILLLNYLYLRNTFTRTDFVRGIRIVLPFAAVVAVYLGIRFAALGFSGSGSYKSALNTMILLNLWDFFKWSLNDLDLTLSLLAQITQYRFLPAIHIAFMLLLACAGLFLFLKEKRVLLFSILWFVIALLPVLPYVHHAQNYYVNISVVGISVLIASIASKYGERAKILVGVLTAIYILLSVANVHHQEDYSWVAVRSKLAENDLKEMKSLFPTLPQNAVIYILNTDENDYWAYNFGDLYRVYYHNDAIEVFFENKEQLPAVFKNRDNLYVVFKLGGHLYDVTKQFKKIKDAKKIYEQRFDLIPLEAGGLSNVIDFSKGSWEKQLLKGWYNIEPGGYRWMAKTSETLLRNQEADKKKIFHLLIKGSAVLDHYPSKKMKMVLKINETIIAKKLIEGTGDYSVEADFAGSFPQIVRLAIELDKSFVPNHVTNSTDTRELGVTVSRIEFW
jgi:hypothetical protein